MKQYSIVNRGLYTNYFHSCPYVVKLSYTLAFQDWRLSMGSIPTVAVKSRVTSLLTSSDVRISRQFGSLPKRQQPKRRTYEKARKVWGAQLKRCGAHSLGMPNLELEGSPRPRVPACQFGSCEPLPLDALRGTRIASISRGKALSCLLTAFLGSISLGGGSGPAMRLPLGL